MADKKPNNRRGSVKGGGRTGNPAHVPTKEQREFVKMATACGMPQTSIGRYLDVSPDTLQRHYRRELDLGAEEANLKVAGTLFRMATDPTHKDSQRAAQFWLQGRAGWRTRDETRHSFALGGEEPGAAPDPNAVQPAEIVVRFNTSRPKGLPGAPPEDQG